MKKKYPIQAFEDNILPFEKEQKYLPLFRLSYDALSALAFGDYMTPPPADKQVTPSPRCRNRYG